MPKKFVKETVLQDWVCGLTFQMQALLLTAMRGPDENNKFNAAKAIVRYLRGIVIKPAGEWAGNPTMILCGESMINLMTTLLSSGETTMSTRITS
jgi:hypothetical protein